MHKVEVWYSSMFCIFLFSLHHPLPSYPEWFYHLMLYFAWYFNMIFASKMLLLSKNIKSIFQKLEI